MIVPDVYLGGRITSDMNEDLKLKVNGHAEWKGLQLDGEVRSGAWRILRIATSQDVFFSNIIS